MRGHIEGIQFHENPPTFVKLPKLHAWKCLEGFHKRKIKEKFSNLETWLRSCDHPLWLEILLPNNNALHAVITISRLTYPTISAARVTLDIKCVGAIGHIKLLFTCFIEPITSAAGMLSTWRSWVVSFKVGLNKGCLNIVIDTQFWISFWLKLWIDN